MLYTSFWEIKIIILGSEASRKFGKNLDFRGNVVQVKLRAQRFFVRENICLLERIYL